MLGNTGDLLVWKFEGLLQIEYQSTIRSWKQNRNNLYDSKWDPKQFLWVMYVFRGERMRGYFTLINSYWLYTQLFVSQNELRLSETLIITGEAPYRKFRKGVVNIHN